MEGNIPYLVARNKKDAPGKMAFSLAKLNLAYVTINAKVMPVYFRTKICPL